MLDGTEGTISGGISPNVEDENTDQGNMDIDLTIVDHVKGFRHNSLVVATYPWTSGIVMAPSLLNTFEKNHFGVVSR
jgi:hypothetical protein